MRWELGDQNRCLTRAGIRDRDESGCHGDGEGETHTTVYSWIKSCMQTDATWKLESPFGLTVKSHPYLSSLKIKSDIYGALAMFHHCSKHLYYNF